MILCGHCGRIHRRLVATHDGEKISAAENLDRFLGAAPYRFLVDGCDRGGAAGLAHDARMQHAVKNHVVEEGRLAEQLRREVDALNAFRPTTP